MKNDKICVYAICKNESKYVNTWVNSMKEADYICILDTGSTDDTYERIKASAKALELEGSSCKLIYDQKVINPWRFDVARVESMKLCPEDTDIFVCTDLDEFFEPGWADPLREHWDGNKYDRCVYLYTWSHLENGAAGRIFRYDKIHGKGYTWKFPVHESLCRVITDNLRIENSTSRYLDLTKYIMLHHFPDKEKSRSSYLPLLELRAQEYPEDTFGLIYLAHEYNYRKKFDKSIETINNIMARPDYDMITPTEKASCLFFRGDDYKALGDYSNALNDYLKALEIDPTLREPYLKLASLFSEMKLYNIAVEYAKLSIEKGIRHYSWIEKDNSWSYGPYDIMAVASFYAGNKRDSLAYAYKAYSYDPDNERLKKNIKLIIDNMSEIEMIN